MNGRTSFALLLASSMVGAVGIAAAQDKTVTIESWRNDDFPSGKKS